MEIPQIKDKVTARAFALALSVEHRKALFMGNEKYSPNKTVVDIAKQWEEYLIGDANLPEIVEDPTNKVLNIWDKVRESTESKIEDTQNEAN